MASRVVFGTALPSPRRGPRGQAGQITGTDKRFLIKLSDGEAVTIPLVVDTTQNAIHTEGGDERGQGALDLQTSRTADDQVAAGPRSALLAGARNRTEGFAENAAVLCGEDNAVVAENSAVLAGRDVFVDTLDTGGATRLRAFASLAASGYFSVGTPRVVEGASAVILGDDTVVIVQNETDTTVTLTLGIADDPLNDGVLLYIANRIFSDEMGTPGTAPVLIEAGEDTSIFGLASLGFGEWAVLIGFGAPTDAPDYGTYRWLLLMRG